jgi:hypothetical protein
MNATHPLAQLSAAEAALISSIHAAAARFDAIGTSSLESALARLRDAAHAASARLADAGAAVASAVSDVLESVLCEAMGIRTALAGDEREPEPAAAFAGYTHCGEPEGTVAGVSPDTPATPAPAPTSSPEPRRTGFAVVDALLEVAAEAEAEGRADPAPRAKCPAVPALFTPDGPTLFDQYGNAEADPTDVLVGPKAVEYSPPPATAGDDAPVYPVASPRRKKKGR